MSGLPGLENRTFPFCVLCQRKKFRHLSIDPRGLASYLHIKALIMHLVKVEDWARCIGRKQALDDGETELCVRTILNHSPEI